MGNLDQSINNQSILDESFSSMDAFDNTTMNAPDSTGNTVSKPRIPVKYSSLPRASVAIAPKAIAVVSEAAKNPIEAPLNTQGNSVAQNTQYATPYFGGGSGGGFSDTEDSKRESESEKMIFGVKAKYVYVSALLLASAFIYLKFIKK